MHCQRLVGFSVGLGLIAGVVPPSTCAAAEGQQNAGLEEIVVTAQKRS